MRKLKLQVQVTLDGFVAGPNSEMDFFTWNWGDDIKQYVTDLTNSVDTILLGRKLAEGFIPYWKSYQENPETSNEFGNQMVDYPKVVFTKTLKESQWENTKLATGDLAEEVNRLKSASGKDMIAYGGANFVSNLIKAGLIDDYHIFINPVAVGEGMRIFTQKTNLQLVELKEFECGIVVMHYQNRK